MAAKPIKSLELEFLISLFMFMGRVVNECEVAAVRGEEAVQLSKGKTRSNTTEFRPGLTFFSNQTPCILK